MSHLPILPILIAAFSGFLLTLLGRRPLAVQRRIAVAGTLAGLAAAAAGVAVVAEGQPLVYALGDWPAPFGIVLVLDRLSALMVLLTAVTAAVALGAALNGWDERGRMFHALFQFQLMGICGAFLTGDIFNLFVFFEVLLIASYGLMIHGGGRDRMQAGLQFVFFEILLLASYGLLLHGGGPERSRAAVKYVTVNLTGSALFLVGVGALYGVTGTLNMADLAQRIPEVAPEDQGLLRISAFVLLVVFGTKAALIPLFLWLPDTYSRASAPVAALFAIMTKIGVYAILRVYTISFGAPGSPVADAVGPWLLGAAALTLLAGMLGALAATELRRLVSYLLIASVGTMLLGVGVFSEHSIASALYYLVHSTIAAAALFLLADPLGRERGEHGDRPHAEALDRPRGPVPAAGHGQRGAAAAVGFPGQGADPPVGLERRGRRPVVDGDPRHQPDVGGGAGPGREYPVLEDHRRGAAGGGADAPAPADAGVRGHGPDRRGDRPGRAPGALRQPHRRRSGAPGAVRADGARRRPSAGEGLRCSVGYCLIRR